MFKIHSYIKRSALSYSIKFSSPIVFMESTLSQISGFLIEYNFLLHLKWMLLIRFLIVLQNLSTIPNCLWFPTSTYLILISYCFNKSFNFIFVNSDPESHSMHKQLVIFNIGSIDIFIVSAFLLVVGVTNANREWTSLQINKYFILLFDPDKFDISSKSNCNISKGLSFGDTLGKNLFIGFTYLYCWYTLCFLIQFFTVPAAYYSRHFLIFYKVFLKK